VTFVTVPEYKARHGTVARPVGEPLSHGLSEFLVLLRAAERGERNE
jgi:hypothetical protein